MLAGEFAGLWSHVKAVMSDNIDVVILAIANFLPVEVVTC